MRIREIIAFIFLISILIPCGLFGQISQGGLPIQFPEPGLKSLKADNDVIVMPAVDNEQMRLKYNQPDDIKLKPFQFAVSFDVNLNTKNSGNWQTVGDVNVWQLKIRSSDAYSINLILDQYILPKDARLFLINEQYGDIKGAYTSVNNSESRILAIEPVQGDELIVQYEEPVNPEFQGEFRIYKIAHDFIGITGDKLHRPLGVSGECNVNINCDIADEVELMRDAVCRIMIEGREFCTGALMNNTGYDGIPYVLTACHCIPTQIKAQTSVFLFNYESPYCSVYNSPPIDGDVSHSISGSSLKSSFDSLDFALVRLDMVPSYPFRPYLLGWNRLAVAPSNSICIHHPWGDIKKYSKDLNPPVTGTFPGSIYQQNGFWNVKVWEYGVTEPGASGAPFLDQNKYVVGVLTGGAASCTSRKNDFFTKFNLAWDYRKEPDKQLKVWLDPINSAFQKIDGMFLFSNPKLQCKPITNFNNDDTNTLIRISSGLTNKGYWSGSNK